MLKRVNSGFEMFPSYHEYNNVSNQSVHYDNKCVTLF